MADMSAISIAINGVDNLSGPVGSASRSLSGLQTAAGGITTSLGNMAVAAGKAAVAVGAISLTAVAGGFAAATTTAASFEKQISAIGAVSGLTGAELGQLQSKALELGAATSFSASEAAKGIEELAKAGVSIEAIMSGAAAASLNLAAAGAVSTTESATIISNALNVFGLAGDKAEHVANIIAASSSASALDVGQFGFAMASAGNIAATMGLTIDELGTAFSQFADKGLKGADMGTSFKATLVGLIPDTKEQIKLFKELGLMTENGANQFFTAEGKMKSYSEVSEILKTSMAGLTRQQQIQHLQTLFGTDGMRTAIVMMEGGAAAAEEYDNKLKGLTAAEMAATRLDNLSGSIEKFKGSAETAGILFGMKFTPVIKKGVDIATEALNKALPSIEAFAAQMAGGLDRAIDTAMKAGPTFLAFGKYLALAATEGETMSDWLTHLPEQFQKPAIMAGTFVAAVRSVALGIADLVKGVAAGGTGGIMETLTVGIGQLQAAFNTLLPIVQTIGAAIVTNVIETFKFFTGTVLPPVLSIIQQTAGLVTGTLMPAFSATGAVLRGIFGETLAWLAQTVWPPFLSIVRQTSDFFTGVILPTLPAVAGALRTTLGETVQWLARDIWPMLTTAATVAWQFISGTIVPALPTAARALREVLGGAIQWIAEDGWPMLLDAGRTVVQWLTGPLVAAVRTAVEWIGPKLQAVANWVIEEGWPMLVSAGGAFVSWVSGTAIPAITNLVGWLGPKIMDAVNWVINTGWPTLVTAGGAVVSWITGAAVPALTDLWNWISPKLQAAIDTLVAAWPTVVTAGEKFSGWVTGVVVPALTDFWNWLSPKIQVALDTLIAAWPTVVTAGEKFSGWVTGTVVPALTDFWNWLSPKVTVAFETLVGYWPTVVTTGGQVWTMLQEGIKWLKDIWTELDKQKVWDDLNTLWKTAHQMGTQLINDVLGGDQGLGAQLTHTSLGASNVVREFKSLVELAQGTLDFLNGVADGLNKIKAFLDFMGESSLFEKITGRKFGQAAADETLIGPGGKWINTDTIPLINSLFGGGKPAPAGAGIPGGGNVMSAPSDPNDATGYVKYVAAQMGLDPEEVARVVAKEGPGGWQATGNFRTGSSYGPLQLHYAGGADPKRGMGDDFTRDTGIDLRTDKSVEAGQAAVRYAIERLKNTGDYREWYGADNAFPNEGGRFKPVSRISSTQAAPAASGGKKTYEDQWGNQWNLSDEDIKRRPGGMEGLTLVGPANAGTGAPAGTKTSPLYVTPIAGMGTAQLHHGSHPGGSDIFAPEGTPISSIGAGRVLSVGTTGPGGNSVLIQGDDGKQYYYAHLKDKPNVVAGQVVEPGTNLGSVGRTGNAANTPAHLHLGIGDDIINGTGPAGGAGSNFNAVGFLNDIVDGKYTGPITAMVGATNSIPPAAGTANMSLQETATSLEAAGTAAAAGAPQLSGIGAALAPMVAQMDEGRVSVAGMTDAIIQQAGSQGVASVAAEQYSAGLITQKDALLQVLAGFSTTTPAAATLHEQLTTGAITVDQAAIAFAGLATTTATASGEMLLSATTVGTEVPAQFTIMKDGAVAAVDLMSAGTLASVDLMSAGALTSVTAMGDGTLLTVTEMAGTTVSTVTDMQGEVVDQTATMADGVTVNLGDMGTESTRSVDEMAGTITTTMRDASGRSVTTVTDMAGKVVAQFGVIKTGASSVPPVVKTMGDSWKSLPTPNVSNIVSEFKKIESAANKAKEAVNELGEHTGSKSGSGKSSGLGKKAMGGWTVPNQMTLVGEEGPELISDSRSRYVYTAAETRSIMGGGQIDYDRLATALASARPDVNFTQHIDAAPSASEIQRGTERAFRRLATDWDFA